MNRNSHLWSQPFRGVCHHLFVDFHGMPLLNASTGANKISEKLQVARVTDWPKILHTRRGRQCLIISDPTYSLVSPKCAPLWLFHLHYGQWHDCARKSCAMNDSPIGLLVSNFHIYGGAWPHKIARYYAPWGTCKSSDQRLQICQVWRRACLITSFIT